MTQRLNTRKVRLPTRHGNTIAIGSDYDSRILGVERDLTGKGARVYLKSPRDARDYARELKAWGLAVIVRGDAAIVRRTVPRR